MRKREPERGHALFNGFVVNQIDERIDDDADRRYAVVGFYLSNVADDRRRAGASVTDGHDHQAVLGLNLTP
jgi:nucleoside-triphosphatase THEP1